METKLTDFTSKELTFLYIVINDRMKDFQNSIETIEKFDPSQTKYDLYEFYNEQVDLCSQLMTKIDEAALIVKMREITLSN